MKQIAAVFLLIFSVSTPAFAYLDPGTGSLILQGLFAAIAIVGITIKTYWYRILAFFGKESPTSVLEDEDPSETSDKT